jgi:hypothetical protein
MKILLHLFLVLLPVTACSQNAPMNTRQDYTQPYTRSSLIADVVADRGYATMVFDHSFVGSSEGHPRAYEDPEVKGSDWRSAITFAQTLSDIDAECIAGIGICGSGVYLPCGVKDDPRMKAVVSVVPSTIMDIVVTASDEQLLQMKADYENGAEPDRLHMIEEGSAELAGRETKVLTDEEMARIAALDKGRSAFFSHQDPAIVEWFGQMVEERKKQGHHPASEKKAW